jgi:hypothetical protein
MLPIVTFIYLLPFVYYSFYENVVTFEFVFDSIVSARNYRAPSYYWTARRSQNLGNCSETILSNSSRSTDRFSIQRVEF